jgi:hypothetical protein
LLDRWCQNPAQLAPEVYQQWLEARTTGGQLPEAYAHAHYIWYVFSAIGVMAFVGLWVFKFVTGTIDRRRAAGPV